MWRWASVIGLSAGLCPFVVAVEEGRGQWPCSRGWEGWTELDRDSGGLGASRPNPCGAFLFLSPPDGHPALPRGETKPGGVLICLATGLATVTEGELWKSTKICRNPARTLFARTRSSPIPPTICRIYPSVSTMPSRASQRMWKYKSKLLVWRVGSSFRSFRALMSCLVKMTLRPSSL